MRRARRPTRSGHAASLPSQTSANASPPRPHDTGSTTVIAAAAAIAASTALPPFHSILSPACAASGCDVDTTLRANTGTRVVGYGLRHENGAPDRFE